MTHLETEVNRNAAGGFIQQEKLVLAGDIDGSTLSHDLGDNADLQRELFICGLEFAKLKCPLDTRPSYATNKTHGELEGYNISAFNSVIRGTENCGVIRIPTSITSSLDTFKLQNSITSDGKFYLLSKEDTLDAVVSRTRKLLEEDFKEPIKEALGFDFKIVAGSDVVRNPSIMSASELTGALNLTDDNQAHLSGTREANTTLFVRGKDGRILNILDNEGFAVIRDYQDGSLWQKIVVAADKENLLFTFSSKTVSVESSICIILPILGGEIELCNGKGAIVDLQRTLVGDEVPILSIVDAENDIRLVKALKKGQDLVMQMPQKKPGKNGEIFCPEVVRAARECGVNNFQNIYGAPVGFPSLIQEFAGSELVTDRLNQAIEAWEDRKKINIF